MLNNFNSKIKTKIDIYRKPLSEDNSIKYGDKILIIGSCFAENIGKYLYNLAYDILLNPFGVQYNPLSISETLEYILGIKDLDIKDLFEHNGLFHSFLHHGSFSNIDKEKAFQSMQNRLNEAREHIKETKYLMLTWGTSYVYRLRDNNNVVSNCHKLSENKFIRQLESSKDLFDKFSKTIEILLQYRPDIKIISTISPIRHLRDTAHGNNISKANLMIFDDMLRQKFGEDKMIYFDAYEIMMDELRDYRYYDRDLVHPNELAIDIIKEKFEHFALSKNEEEIRNAIRNFSKQISHRPLNMDEMSIELMNDKNKMIAMSLKNKYPNIKIENLLQL